MFFFFLKNKQEVSNLSRWQPSDTTDDSHFTRCPAIDFQSLRVILMTFSGIRFPKARLLLDPENRKVSAVFITALQCYVGREMLLTFPSDLCLNIEFKKFLQG